VGSLEELDNRLKDIFQTRSDKTLFVRATPDVEYGRVVEAMDVARGAGVERIGIISETLAGEAPAPEGGGE
jgi:biopolymer transport protein ExbD